ncbi:DNA damage-repair/toleration protein DRT100 [Linum grandiflorum]
MPGSNFFSSWDFTADPCNFAGVYCQSDRVVALNLGDPTAGSPGLIGNLDPAVGKLTALAELTLVPGRVMGSLPDSISHLTELRFLAINRNFLTGAIPDSISRLTNLKTLDLSYNQLTGTVPPSIGSIPGLSNLILCHNRLSGSVPAFGSRSLTRIDLSHNQLSGLIPPYSFPSSLQYLSLSKNRLVGPVDGFLNRLDQLNYLDLSVNLFSGSIPGRVFTFPITNLHLQRNLLAGPVQPGGQSVSIPTVDLSYNRLSGTISSMFSAVRNLYLNNNRFIGEVPSSLVERLLAGEMETLYLQHNYLTGIKINPAAGIPARSSMCLQYNCMVAPVQSPCPLKAGRQKVRPFDQCKEWKG